MAKYDGNWWFGENSIWQQSGLKSGLTGEGDREGGFSGFFSALGDSLGNFFDKPIEMKHGPDQTVKYAAIGIVLYMLIKK